MKTQIKSHKVIVGILCAVSLMSLAGCQNQVELEEMKAEPHPSVVKMWESFSNQDPQFQGRPIPEAFHFCDNEKDANACAVLVMDGIKQATSTSLWWFEKNDHKFPQPGDVYVITDWAGVANAIVQTTKVDRVPFDQVTAEYAKIEGEGDQTLEYWQRTHWDYYSREMKPFDESPTQDMVIICEQFKTIWK